MYGNCGFVLALAGDQDCVFADNCCRFHLYGCCLALHLRRSLRVLRVLSEIVGDEPLLLLPSVEIDEEKEPLALVALPLDDDVSEALPLLLLPDEPLDEE
jgi:hypothetical protein